MERWILQIELKSDFSTGTGESVPGMLNNKTALENGIPFIPAKRIKGCLLEAGKELADNGIINAEMLSGIFGRPGMATGGKISIGNGHLHTVPWYLFGREKAGQIVIGNYEALQKNIKNYPDIEDMLLEDIFTRKRTRTAIDQETGTAKEHTLRTVQVVPAGVIFSCRLEGELSKEEEKALNLCVKGLRHMGICITRGMGEVHCTLKKVQFERTQNTEKNISRFNTYTPEEEISLSYEIELELPVIMTDNQEDGAEQISASAISGAFAAMYIKRHSLGSKAHENGDFRRIFLRDGVQFGNAFLKKDGITYVPAPKAFAKPKGDDKKWFNIMADQNNLRRKNISGQVFLKNNGLYVASPLKEIHFHHARPADRRIGHALNDRAEDISVRTGQFFQYMALSKGQTFVGTWKGKVKDIRELAECIEECQNHIVLGKSRSAEYGSCRFRILWDTLTKCQDKHLADHSARGKEWLIWLLSPLVYRDDKSGAYETGGRLLMNQMSDRMGCKIELADSICGYTVLNGYNSKWKLPMVSCLALSAGSSFYIRADKDIEACEIEGVRWGMLTGKGCGQVKAVPWEECIDGTLKTFALSLGTQDNILDKMGTAKEDEFLTAVLDYQKKRLECQKAALQALEKMDEQQTLPIASDIFLLIQLLKYWDGNTDCYEMLKKESERISGEEKRKRILQFIRPCKEASFEFIIQYLEAAKWKVRKGGVQG